MEQHFPMGGAGRGVAKYDPSKPPPRVRHVGAADRNFRDERRGTKPKGAFDHKTDHTGKFDTIRCISCKMEGHVARDCPQAHNKAAEVSLCSLFEPPAAPTMMEWVSPPVVENTPSVGFEQIDRNENLDAESDTMHTGVPPRKIKCHCCGEEGHSKRQCPRRSRATFEAARIQVADTRDWRRGDPPVEKPSERKAIVCHNCNEEGHIKRFCPKRESPIDLAVSGPSFHSSPHGHDNRRGARTENRHFERHWDGHSRPPPECYNCGEEGHLSRNCPKKKFAVGLSGSNSSLARSDSLVAAVVVLPKPAPPLETGITYDVVPVDQCAKINEVYRLLMRKDKRYKFGACGCEDYPKCTCVKKVVILVNRPVTAECTRFFLSSYGINAFSIYKKTNQSERDHALAEFQHGQCRILIVSATEVHSCASSLNDVPWLVFMDLPTNMDEFNTRKEMFKKEGKNLNVTIFYDRLVDAVLADGLSKAYRACGQSVPEILAQGFTEDTESEAESGDEELESAHE